MDRTFLAAVGVIWPELRCSLSAGYGISHDDFDEIQIHLGHCYLRAKHGYKRNEEH